MMSEKIYAEDVNYWKTSRKTSIDGWIDKAKKEIQEIDGIIKEEGFAMAKGKSAYLLAFTLDNEFFKMIWPVLLPYHSGQEKSAKIQAATALYYEVKSACVKTKFLGKRAAFIGYLELEDGRTVLQLNNEEMQDILPESYKVTVLALTKGG